MTDTQKHAAPIHKIVDGWIDCPEKAALLAGAKALEAQEVKVTRVMDPDAASYHARIAAHCDRLEAIQERIARALVPQEQGRWIIVTLLAQPFLIPVDRLNDWTAWHTDREAGESSEILPGWATRVEPGMVITGWERP